MIRKLVFFFAAALICLSYPAPATAAPPQLTIMTRNMDAGSDFWYVLSADPSNPNAILVAITKTYQEMIASKIAQRADGIAAEIQFNRPDIVALQEVTTLSSGAYSSPNLKVDASGLDSLIVALRARGLHYKVIFEQKNSDISLPALDASYQNLIQVGLTDYDAILVRRDLLYHGLTVRSIQAKHFSDAATLTYSVAGQSIPFYRGWISMDANSYGVRYRFVTTHLETFSPDFQAAQTNELLLGPLNTDLPIILAGDLNSDAINPSWASGPAYGILTSDGLVDAWSQLRPTNPGVTWPLFVEDSGIGPGTPQRIDLVLTKRSTIKPTLIRRTGLSRYNHLMSSDHAGIDVVFNLHN